MLSSMVDWTLFTKIFLTVFIVIDPLGIVPLFISITSGMDEKAKRAAIVKAIMVAFLVMAVFALAGRYVLGFVGISPGAFYVAGGVLLFMIALDMLFGQHKRAKRGEEEDDGDATSIAVFPLAIPMIAGPGTISTILLYSSGEYDTPISTLMLAIAVLLTLGAVFALLRASSLILKVLGKTGVSVIERIMGLLLAGLAVQFAREGLIKLGILGL
jgi:multiple antibiotic resistance protein